MSILKQIVSFYTVNFRKQPLKLEQDKITINNKTQSSNSNVTG